MASKGEVQRYESKQMNRTKEANQTVKHRVGNKTGQAANTSRQSSGKGGGVSHDQKDALTKSRSGPAAAIKALCGKAAAAASKQQQQCKSAKGSSSSGGDGSIVKAPGAVPIGAQMRCDMTPRSDKERSIASGDERCYDQPYRHIPEKCNKIKEKWQNGVYCRDECGSGIIAKKFEFKHSRGVWCSTPLSMYQATIGELGRQILCREKIVPRDVKPGPPCNVCEYILPPCRGYYRKYDCIRPCEEEYVSYKRGRKFYRDRVERYWEPCQSKDQRVAVDINTFAHQNVYLGAKLRRKFNESIPCW